MKYRWWRKMFNSSEDISKCFQIIYNLRFVCIPHGAELALRSAVDSPVAHQGLTNYANYKIGFKLNL